MQKDKPKIVNIVATSELPTKLNLDKLFLELDLDEKEYETETYPALLAKTRNPRGHVTLYKNGKYIITGISSIDDLEKVHSILIEKLREVGAL